MRKPNKEKLERWFLQACGNPTPAQASALGKVFITVGVGIVAKNILTLWPSIWATSICVTIFCIMLVLAIKYFRLVPRFKWFIKGLPALFIGGMLNYTAMFANGGYMPSVIRTPESARGIYIPLEGANFIYLGDWIGGGFSPGDIVLTATFVAMVVVYLRWGRASPNIESKLAGTAQAIPQEPTLPERTQN